MTGRSPEARARRAQRYRKASDNGRRIACDICKHLHEPPACPPGAAAVRMTIDLPPHVHRALIGRIHWGERSPWIVRLIRRELKV
jgi:hypothetical protein